MSYIRLCLQKASNLRMETFLHFNSGKYTYLHIFKCLIIFTWTKIST